MHMYVPADRYHSEKEKWSDMEWMPAGMEDCLMPVDMNYAHVAMEVDASSKNSTKDMDKAAECNLNRFGLNKL